MIFLMIFAFIIQIWFRVISRLDTVLGSSTKVIRWTGLEELAKPQAGIPDHPMIIQPKHVSERDIVIMSHHEPP